MSEEKPRKINKWSIALIVIPIITVIAIVLVVRWALSSPTVETLVTISIAIGIATFGAVFEIGILAARVSEVTNSVRESISSMKDDIISNADRNTDRIVEAIRAKATE